MSTVQRHTTEQEYRCLLETPRRTYSIRRMLGREAISEMFRFELWTRVEQQEDELVTDDLIGSRVFIRIAETTRDEIGRRIGGMITEASLTASALSQGADLRIVVQPKLVRAHWRQDCRVFRNRTVPEIVGEVLSDAGLFYQTRLSDEYASRPYTVQYNESDLAFVSRLLEDEGIFYYFIDDLNGHFDKMSTTLVLADSVEACDPIRGEALLPYRHGGSLVGRESVRGLSRVARLVPDRIILNDFNFEDPARDMVVDAETECSGGVAYYDFPGKYRTPAEGHRKARLRAEAHNCVHRRTKGATDCPRLTHGARFSVQGAPDEPDRSEWLIVEIAHRFERDRPFRSDFQILRTDVPFRPPVVTPAPRIPNLLPGVVGGPKGEEIYCDKWGHVKVRFPWDWRRVPDEDCSDWVPVLQDDTGQSVAIPRVGWEVLTSFVEGDPDRPVVVGHLYNGAQPFPEPLPEGKTRTVFKSYTYPSVAAAAGESGIGLGLGIGFGSPGPDHGTANMIRIDDAAGSELISVQAQRDQHIVVVNDKKETVGTTEYKQVGGNETINIGGNYDLHIGQDGWRNVELDQTFDVGGNRKRGVNASDSASIGGDASMTIGGTHFRRIGGIDKVSASKIDIDVGVLHIEASLLNNTNFAMADQSLLVGGALIELPLLTKNENNRALRTEFVGGMTFTSTKQELTFDSKQRFTVVGGKLKLDAAKDIRLNGKVMYLQFANLLNLKADGVLALKVGTSIVKLEGDAIGVLADTINITGSSKAHLHATLGFCNSPS